MRKLFNKTKKGFTIVELVIVIGVIGILSAILIPTFVNLNSKAGDAARRSDLAAIYSSYVADVADGYFGEEEVAGKKVEKMYAQNDVCLKESSQTGEDANKFYTYGEDGWNVSLQAKADLETARVNYTITQLETEDHTHLTYQGYEVWAFIKA